MEPEMMKLEKVIRVVKQSELADLKACRLFFEDSTKFGTYVFMDKDYAYVGTITYTDYYMEVKEKFVFGKILLKHLT